MTLPRPGLSLRTRVLSVATLVLLLGADATGHAQRRPSAALEFGQRWSGTASEPSCQARGPNGEYYGDASARYCQWFVRGYLTKPSLSAIVFDDHSVVTWERRTSSTADARRLDDSLMTSLIARGFERIDCAVRDTMTGTRRAELWLGGSVGVHIARRTPKGGLPRLTLIAADWPWNHVAMMCEFSGSKRHYAEAHSGNVLPAYPAMLLDAGILGEVRARFVVDTSGRVEMSTFKCPRSDNELFTSSVRNAVARWRFRPASESGRRLADTVDMLVKFELPDDLRLPFGLVTKPERLPDGPSVRVLHVSLREDRDSTPVPSDSLSQSNIRAAIAAAVDSLSRRTPSARLVIHRVLPFSAKAVIVDASSMWGDVGKGFACFVQRDPTAKPGWRAMCRDGWVVAH